MDIEKERKEFEKEAFKQSGGWATFHKAYGDVYENNQLNFGWKVWLAAKLHAVPEGFVLVPKDELTSTYYWEGAEHTVSCVTEYEMELEKGEIAELEKWEQTKSTKAFFANIYSDEDNFEIVEFDSIEAAQQAIQENKAIIEAQEQKA